MVNSSSKVIRLSSDTLDYLEVYRDLLKSTTDNVNLIRYVDELNYDKIIYCSLSDAINYCTKS